MFFFTADAKVIREFRVVKDNRTNQNPNSEIKPPAQRQMPSNALEVQHSPDKRYISYIALVLLALSSYIRMISWECAFRSLVPSLLCSSLCSMHSEHFKLFYFQQLDYEFQ